MCVRCGKQTRSHLVEAGGVGVRGVVKGVDEAVVVLAYQPIAVVVVIIVVVAAAGTISFLSISQWA